MKTLAKWMIALSILFAGCGDNENDGQITGTYDFMGSVDIARPKDWVPGTGDTTITEMWVSFPSPQTTDPPTVKVYATAKAVVDSQTYTIPLITGPNILGCSDDGYGPMVMNITAISATSFEANRTWNACSCIFCIVPVPDTTLILRGRLIVGLLTTEIELDDQIIGHVTLVPSKQVTPPEFECPDDTSCFDP